MIDLSQFSQSCVLCVGDVMLDRFISGEVKRISPESPVPIILVSETRTIPGGAANVSRNVVALGGRCILVGAVGADFAGRELEALLVESERIEPDLVAVARRPTSEKSRFVAQGQHLLRADREEPGDIPAAAEAAIIERVAQQIGRAQVMVLSDYAKGVLTDRVLSATIGLARRHGIPVVVDPKSPRLGRYAGATVVTPNSNETLAATGIAPSDDALAQAAGAAALAATDVGAVLITRAERGMTLVSRDGGAAHLPASAREVFDVVGAGDTVVASLALCLATGLPLIDAARIANAAAGIVVGKHGTATVTQSELLDELARISLAGLVDSAQKAMDLAQLSRRRLTWQRDGLTVGFTNGCFDILHVGHLHILECARNQCDRLIVALNSDASVRRLKGPTRPLNDITDRARMIAALEAVDAVIVFEEDTPAGLIERLAPDVLVKGADYQISDIAGADFVLARGGKVVTCPLVPERSTSRIIARAALP